MLLKKVKYVLCFIFLSFILVACFKRIKTSRVSYSNSQVVIYTLSSKEVIKKFFSKEIFDTVYKIDDKEASYEEIFLEDIREFIKEMFVLSSIAKERNITLSTDELAELEKVANEYYKILKDSKIEDIKNVSKEEVYDLFYDYLLIDKFKEEISREEDFEISQSEARIILLEYIKLDKSMLKDLEEELKIERDFLKIKKKYDEYSNHFIKLAQNKIEFDEQNILFDLDTDELSPIIKRGDSIYLYKVVSSFDEEETKKYKKELSDKKLKEMLKIEYNIYAEDNKLAFKEDLFESMKKNIKYNLDVKNFFELYKEKFGESNKY